MRQPAFLILKYPGHLALGPIQFLRQSALVPNKGLREPAQAPILCLRQLAFGTFKYQGHPALCTF